LGIELDCAYGVVDRWAKAADLGFPRSAAEEEASAGGDEQAAPAAA
jgi:hypothetical protein